MKKVSGGWRGMLGSRADDPTPVQQGAAEVEGHFWRAHEQATTSSASLVEQTTQLLADWAKHQSIVDTLREQVRLAQARAQELGSSLARITEAFERLRLLALNVGLEGARLGEPSARILGSVAEEVRLQAEQGVVATNDLRGLVDELAPTWSAAVSGVDRMRQTDVELRARVDAAQALAQQAGAAVAELGEWARRMSDTDPETARVLAQATEHARGLVSSLSALGERARREVVAATIGPALHPLLKLLSDLPRSSKADK